MTTAHLQCPCCKQWQREDGPPFYFTCRDCLDRLMNNDEGADYSYNEKCREPQEAKDALTTSYRRGWIAAQEAAAKECDAQEENWCDSPLGYLNEYETGRVNSAIDCASAIRALTPPDAPTGEKGE